jgi:hypothetical protein
MMAKNWQDACLWRENAKVSLWRGREDLLVAEREEGVLME